MMGPHYLFAFASLAVLVQAFSLPEVSAGWFGSNDSGWSEAEKQNFCYFVNSQRADSQAASNINSTGAGYATERQVSEMLALWRLALQEASQVTDSVLDKIHPELKDRYRNQYQKALQYQIAAFEQENPPLH